VTLQGGASLVDKAGNGQFLMNSAGGTLTGTIPAGQKLTVVGEQFSYGGENFHGTTLRLAGAVINDGTLVLDALGSGSTSGGPAIVLGGSIRNKGTIVAEVHDPSWAVQYQAGLTNTQSGRLSVTAGTFDDSSGPAVINKGTVQIGPRALFRLDEGSAFTNERGGRIVPQIASAKAFGQFQLTSPCCVGPGKVIAGGSLLPSLVGGYVPAANTEFPLFALLGGTFSGTFHRLSTGFTADYTHESAAPALVGAIYHKH
jgi:hypothetical protein